MQSSFLPAYPSINGVVLRTLLAHLLRRRRSLRADALRLCSLVTPPILFSGLEHIPAQRPLLITANHFKSPTFSIAWTALSISAALPDEVSWIMSNEWLFEGNPLGFMLRPLMRFVLKSITLAYGFLPMPTMIPGFSTSQQRTAGVRAVIEKLRHQPQSILGLTPEGMDSPTGGLALPPPGAGRFILHIQKMGALILPAAVFEHKGELHVRFGIPYRLASPANLSPSGLDLWARQEVMQPIRQLILEA